MHSTPSQRVRTSGRYLRGSGSNLMVAPSERCSSMPLLRWIGPVRNTPCGTSTRPPPFVLHAAIASPNAAVQSVMPSPRAPNFVTSTSVCGITGAWTRATIASAVSHGATANCAVAQWIWSTHNKASVYRIFDRRGFMGDDARWREATGRGSSLHVRCRIRRAASARPCIRCRTTDRRPQIRVPRRIARSP